MATVPNIAFIVPAYRAADLHKTLQSLAMQTDRDFSVYLADDAVPEDLSALTAEFEDALSVRYTRFEERLGDVSRSKHLSRALSLLRGEPFVCFLEGDAELTQDCVKRLRRTIARHPEYAVYHWNAEILDAAGAPIEKMSRYGVSLRTDKLFRKLFMKGFRAPLPAFVFRTETLLSKGVFDGETYRTDLQNIFACAGETGVRTVRRARIRQRTAAAPDPALQERETLSRLAFFRWSETFFGEDYPISVGDRLDLFAETAARLYPTYTADEVKARFMAFDVCQGTLRKLKASGALRYARKERGKDLKGTI